jgi:hypothetical protein
MHSKMSMGPQSALRAAFALLLIAVVLSPAAGFTLGTSFAQLRGSAARQSTHWRAPLPLLARGAPRRDVPRLTAARREGAGATVMQDAAAATNDRPTALANPAFGDTGGAILLVEVSSPPRSICCACGCVDGACRGTLARFHACALSTFVLLLMMILLLVFLLLLLCV